jgi:hypothetical protein
MLAPPIDDERGLGGCQHFVIGCPYPGELGGRAFTIDRASVDTSIHHEDGVCAVTDGVGEAGGGVDGADGSRQSPSPSPSRTRIDVEPAAIVDPE